jgi:hypothetical protein
VQGFIVDPENDTRRLARSAEPMPRAGTYHDQFAGADQAIENGAK